MLEETGVRGRFAALLAVRQAHGLAFGKSDLFFCCALIPEPGQDALQPQASELADAKWMPLAEYVESGFKGVALYDRLVERCVAWANGRTSGMRAETLASGWTKPRDDLILSGRDE